MNIKKFSWEEKFVMVIIILAIAALLIPEFDFIRTWVLRFGGGVGIAGCIYILLYTAAFRKGVKNVQLKIGAVISLLFFISEWIYFTAVSRPSGTLPTVYLLAASVLLLFWIMILGQKYRKNKE